MIIIFLYWWQSTIQQFSIDMNTYMQLPVHIWSSNKNKIQISLPYLKYWWKAYSKTSYFNKKKCSFPFKRKRLFLGLQGRIWWGSCLRSNTYFGLLNTIFKIIFYRGFWSRWQSRQMLTASHNNIKIKTKL